MSKDFTPASSESRFSALKDGVNEEMNGRIDERKKLTNLINPVLQGGDLCTTSIGGYLLYCCYPGTRAYSKRKEFASSEDGATEAEPKAHVIVRHELQARASRAGIQKALNEQRVPEGTL